MTGIVYKIENLKNGKIYIGETIDYGKRVSKHKSLLNQGTHPNAKLQNSWNLHGEENFQFEIIEECVKEDLMEREIYYIDHYNSIRAGYNILRGRKFDVEYTRVERAKDPLAWNPNRIRTETEILLIKSLQYVFGSIQRPLAKLFGTTSSSINYYYNNTRYVEVCKKFNDSSPLEKVFWFQSALEHTDFSLSLIPTLNEETIKLIWALIDKFDIDKATMMEMTGRSRSGINKIYSKAVCPEAEDKMRQWGSEERDLKVYLFILYLDFQRQSAAEPLMKWAEAFNDYLEREYTISD